MAATVSSLGPPSVGPGNAAKTVGFAASATTRPGMYSNREPLSGNTLCHKNDVERKYAIHENRLASVKASLSLSTPVRLEFMDKRLSKNFHIRRHHEHLVHENLKLLRALEDIHSRSSNVGGIASGRGSAGGGSGPVAGGRGAASSSRGGGGRSRSASGSLTVPGNSYRGKGGGGSDCGSSKLQSKKLNTLLARKRTARAAVVARENHKMLERLTQSKSLYSRETMRKHRKRHQRVLRLRKTDYTAGHLLAATTAMKHWTGGDARDDGFSYSFEGGHHRRHRARALTNRRSTASSTSRIPATTTRGSSCSPIGRAKRSVNTEGAGSMSAPHLPSLLDVGDFYGGGNMLGSPDLEQCLLAAGGGGGGGGKGIIGGPAGGCRPSSRNNALSSAHGENGIALRPSTDGGVVGDESTTREGTDGVLRAGKSFYQPKSTSAGCESTGATRGTDESVDALPPQKSWSGANEAGGGGPNGGSRGRYGKIFTGDGGTGGNQKGGRGGYSSLAGEGTEGSDLDMIFNPLAFPDETEGVRVLIQATKPLEVLNHAGETWICFIRIMAKDPSDGQLDIRIIHDREEVCRRLLSVDEANKICERADNAVALRDRSLAGKTPPGPSASPAEDSTSLQSPSSSSITAPAGDHSAPAAGCPLSHGLRRSTIIESDLNDLLGGLFQEADTKGKGYLTPEQLTSIMHHAELGLTGPELQLVIAEADDNADGTIDYYEFIPMAYNLVHAFRARRRACVEMQDESLDLDQQAIHALYDAEFDGMVKQLKDLCKSFDPDDKGVVTRADFKQCISADRCGGLTKIESKLLLNLMPKDSQGNVVYRKLGAGLEQVRFTTLRNTVAEAAATDTQKHLMDLCREEDAKSDALGSKPHMKSNGDATITVGGKQYSGVLRARQLTKLLLNAPLLSLSRLHVTALMSQAHIVDGMVNYVKLVPMMAKTIEGIFDPRSLKMRHDIFNVHGVGGAGSAAGGALQQQGAATVLGKTRDDIQKLFMDVLRDDKLGSGIEQLKDPETFAKCMASLDLNLEPDIINALWEAADVDGREGTTFVDVVDFCFNCVLFLEREKQVKALQRSVTSAGASQSNTSGWGVAAVAAAAAGSGVVPTEKLDPLLNLARALVRHAKVTSPAEGKVGLKFLDDSQIDGPLVTDDGNVGGDGAGADGLRVTSLGIETTLVSDDEEDTKCSDDGSDENFGKNGAGVEIVGRCSSDQQVQLRSMAPDATILVRIRRRVPIVGSAGQPLTTTSTRGRVIATSQYPPGAVAQAPRSKDNASYRGDVESRCTTGDNTAKALHDVGSSGSIETEAASRGQTRDMVVQVYWEGTARDRAYVEVYSAKLESGRRGKGDTGSTGNCSARCLRLGVRVPTLAVVDAQAAAKFAERVAQQVAIEVDDGSSMRAGQQQSTRLRLGGVDAKAVVGGS